jgi:hypothetical protein
MHTKDYIYGKLIAHGIPTTRAYESFTGLVQRPTSGTTWSHWMLNVLAVLTGSRDVPYLNSIDLPGSRFNCSYEIYKLLIGEKILPSNTPIISRRS